MDSEERSIQNKRSRGRGRYGERRLANKVNGIVVGRSKCVITPDDKAIRINCQKPPDVVTSVFSFESKWLLHVPKNITKVMTQASTNAPEGLIPVGVIGDREAHVVYYVLCEKDFLDLFIGGK